MIQDSGEADVELRDQLLAALARALSAVLDEHGVAHGLIGGGALRYGHGRNRQTEDLDFRIEAPRFIDTFLDQAFERIPDWTWREPTEEEWVRGSEGIIARHTPSGHTVQTRVDFVAGPCHPLDEKHMRPEDIETRNGIRMFTLDRLARYKLQTLIGPHRRRAARDVADATWLMENHEDRIELEDKVRLARWLRRIDNDPDEQAAWRKALTAMTESDRELWQTALPALAHATMKDQTIADIRSFEARCDSKAVRVAERLHEFEQNHGPAELRADVGSTGHMTLAGNARDSRNDTRTLLDAATPSLIAQVLILAGRRLPQEAPLLERTLERERSQLLARLHARTR